MRIDFTPSEIALMRECVRIAAEDGSIYPKGTAAEQNRIDAMIEAIRAKLGSTTAVKAGNGNAEPK